MTGLVRLAQESIAGFALHALWQIPLIGAAAWLAIRIGRPRVLVAHGIWSATLALCVFMPGLSTFAGRRAALEAERAARLVSVEYSAVDYTGPLPAMQREPRWLRLVHQHIGRHGLQPFSFALPVWVERSVAVAYALVAMFFLLRLALAWRRSARLVRNARTEALPHPLIAALLRQCETMGIDGPAIRISREIAGPALAGVRRPTLLLPESMVSEMTATEIDAVLAHELSHLRRRDPLMHALSSLLVIPVGFHPAAVWVARRVRQTREMACDADAAEQMGSPTRYARALLQVAERAGSGPAHVAGLGLFTTGLGFLGTSLELFGAGGAMEERMETLMHSKDGMRNRFRMGVAATLAATAVVAATMVQVQPALAAEQPKDPQQEQPHLIGGEHARDQLRDAQRRLDTAEQRAATPEERNKIATARNLAKAAEEQIAAASGKRGTVTVHGPEDMDAMQHQLNIHVDPNIDMDALRIQIAQGKALSERLQAKFNSPEWKEEMDRQRAKAEKLRQQFNSPEWKAQIAAQQADAERMRVEAEKMRDQFEAQRAEAEKLRAKFDSPEWRAKIDAQVAEGQKQRVIILQQLNSPEMQRQIAQAKQIAKLEMPEMTILSAPPAPAVAGQPSHVDSKVMAGNKISGNNPAYPAEAKEKHIQGAVVLHAIISEAGTVESLQIVSSADPLLSKPAVEAVQTWIYRPYLLNGNPTAVDTTITVNFSFAG